MDAFISFLLVLFPELMALARELFVSHGGKSEEAHKEIADLRDAVMRNRKARDEQLRQKHGG